MKPETRNPKSELEAGEERILQAYREAIAAQVNYALKALICGQLMLEYRAALQMTSHREKSSALTNSSLSYHNWTDRTKPRDQQFIAWLSSRDIAVPTAYRWMEAADRVSRLQLGLLMSDELPSHIEVEGTRVPLSVALTAPEAELPEAALKYRQDVSNFMADKTLAEACSAALDGESPAHRITRAADGKRKGGAGQPDRKDWPEFVFRKFGELAEHLSHWDRMSAGQKAEILGAVKAAFLGQDISWRNRRVKKFGLWPEELCAVAVEALRQRLRESKR
jgi:hypothetical protein